METRLFNVRDIHWDSSINVRSSGNIPSSKTNFVGFDTSVAQTGVSFRENRIAFSGSEPGLKYSFRPTSTFNIPTHIKVRMHASNIQTKLYIDDLEIGDITSFSNLPEVKERTIVLPPYIVEKILSYRLFPNYENYSIQCVGTPNLVGSSNPVAIYGFEVSLIGTGTYQNFISNTISSPIRLLPTGVTRTNVHWKNHDNAGLNVERFNTSPTGVGVNSTFIEAQNEPTLVNEWRNTMPSGYLSVFFNSNTSQTVNVNRARVSFNMSLPVSGSRGNFRDKIDIYGKSRTFNYAFNNLLNNEWLNIAEPGSEDSDPPVPTGLHPLSASCWGYSDIIESSGFVNYNVDLVFLDPERILTPSNSGNASSRRYAHLAAFQNLELQFVGVPSGARLSAMELILETQNSNSVNLYVNSNLKQTGQHNMIVNGSAPKVSSFTDLYTAKISNFNSSYPCGIILDENNDPVIDEQNEYVVSEDSNCDDKNVTLYTFGIFKQNNSLNLNTRASFKINNAFPELDPEDFAGAWAIEDNIPPLFINGFDKSFTQTTLFLKTPEPINSSATLHTIGTIPIPINTNMIMYVDGSNPEKSINNFSLVVKSSLNQSLFNTNNLFLNSTNFDPHNYMPLYTTNSSRETQFSNMNLYIGQNILASNNTSLYICNNNVTLGSFRRLFLKGANNYKEQDQMNLFIQRQFEGLSSATSMFVKTVDGSLNSGFLHTVGGNYASSILDYTTSEYQGVWFYDFSNNYLQLSINATDFPSETCRLFISGF